MINRFSIYDKLGAPQPFDPNATYTTSPFLSPFALAAVRLTFAFYTLFTLIFVLVWDAVRLHTAHAFFSYFTELSYIGLCSYFFASGVQTLVYALSQGRSYPLERWPKILQFLHVLLFTTISTFPILVTIVFWGALFPGNPFTDKFDVWSNVSLHALNTVFSLFEILFTHASPTPWLHIPFVIIFLGCYLGVAYITHATQGFYTYSFLNPAKEGKALAGWIVGIAAAGVIIFCITRSICVLRERLVRRSSISRFSDAGDTELPNERLDEWETVELDRSTRTRARVEKGGLRGKKSAESHSHSHSGEGGDTSFETDEKAGMRMNVGRRRNELV